MEIKEPVILVVDDDKDIVGAIAKLLEMEGYKVIKAYDGLEALEKLTENSIQLILIDVMMPKLDGLSTMMKGQQRISLYLCFPLNLRIQIRCLGFQWALTIT